MGHVSLSLGWSRAWATCIGELHAADVCRARRCTEPMCLKRGRRRDRGNIVSRTQSAIEPIAGYAIVRSRLVKSVSLVRDPPDPLVCAPRAWHKYSLPCPRHDSPMTQRINTRHGESNRWLLVLPRLLPLLLLLLLL